MPCRPTVGAPPAIQVDARTQQAFLTQAFLWMFVGLGVTAGVAYIVQSNERLLEFAANNLLILIIAQLALVFVIGLGIRRISATVALGLFFVYAASLGIDDRPDRDGLHVGVRRLGLRLIVCDVRRCRHLRARDEAFAGSDRQHAVHGADRPARRDASSTCSCVTTWRRS